MFYVYSTLTNDNAYTSWGKGGGDVANKERTVVILGGSNRANKTLVTPKGVVTKVSDDDLEFLKKNRVFQLHVKNGFVSYSKVKTEAEKATRSMTEKDASAPLTPNSFDEGKAPTTGAVADKK